MPAVNSSSENIVTERAFFHDPFMPEYGQQEVRKAAKLTRQRGHLQDCNIEISAI